MTETRKISMKDTDVFGWTVEVTKGIAPASTAYNNISGVIQNFTFGPDDDRQPHNRSGDRFMASEQTWGKRSGTGRLVYKLASDFTTGDGATTSLLSIALGDASLGLEVVSGKILTPGTRYLQFDAGTVAFELGEELTGGTSGATAIIKDVLLVSGTFVGNDAAGYLILTKITNDFQNNETITDSGSGSADAVNSQKTIGSDMYSFSCWLRQTNLPSDATEDHVLTDCQINSATLNGIENGDMELELNFKFADWVNFAPYNSTLPPEPDMTTRPFFKWTSADGSIAFARAGTEQRIKTFAITFDNGVLHPVPKAGQRMPAEFIRGMFKTTGTLEFFTNDTELDTIWNTAPWNLYELNYDGQASNFTEGVIVTGGTSGATAIIVSDSDSGATGSMTVTSVKGQFVDDETLVDEVSGDGNVNGALSQVGKTLAYDGQTANFNLGATLSGQTSGATALIVEDTDGGVDGTLRLKRIQGQFIDNEVLIDDGAVPGEAACDGTLTDGASIDFELTLSKNNAGEYISIKCYNVYPTGNRDFAYNPQEDSAWMIQYPFEVFMNGNIEIDLLG